VFTLRCTRRLLRRLKVSPEPSPLAPTNGLGDWYANLLYARPQQLILCVSERTLLPIVISAKGSDPVPVRLAAEVGKTLYTIGIRGPAVDAELAAMADVTISTTASRQVLGSMNDLASLLEAYLAHGDTLEQAARKLADAPCSPIEMNSPREETIELLSKLPAPLGRQ
jgi:hypothetical protein